MADTLFWKCREDGAPMNFVSEVGSDHIIECLKCERQTHNAEAIKLWFFYFYPLGNRVSKWDYSNNKCSSSLANAFLAKMSFNDELANPLYSFLFLY